MTAHGVCPLDHEPWENHIFDHETGRVRHPEVPRDPRPEEHPPDESDNDPEVWKAEAEGTEGDGA